MNLLLERCAPVNQTGYNKTSPLLIATERDYFDLAEQLIQAGAHDGVGCIWVYTSYECNTLFS